MKVNMYDEVKRRGRNNQGLGPLPAYNNKVNK